MESLYANVEELIAEFGGRQGELFLQFDIEEEECYRTILAMVWIDPVTEAVASEVLMEAMVEKAE